MTASPAPDLGRIRPASHHQQVRVVGVLGQVGPDVLRDVGHDRMQHPQVPVEHPGEHLPGGHPGRHRSVGRQLRLGQLEVPVAVLAPDRRVQQAGRLRELERGIRRVHGAQRLAASIQDPVLGRTQVRRAGSDRMASAGSSAGRCESTYRLAFQTLFANRWAPSRRSGDIRWSMPGAVPLTSAKRSASAPTSSMTPSGSTTLPRVLDILAPTGSRTMPWRYTMLNGSRPVSHSPSIIIRATQKKMMS